MDWTTFLTWWAQASIAFFTVMFGISIVRNMTGPRR
jgi:hypothetical protein